MRKQSCQKYTLILPVHFPDSRGRLPLQDYICFGSSRRRPLPSDIHNFAFCILHYHLADPYRPTSIILHFAFCIIISPTPIVRNCRGGVSPPENIGLQGENGRQNASPTKEGGLLSPRRHRSRKPTESQGTEQKIARKNERFFAFIFDSSALLRSQRGWQKPQEPKL